MRQHTTLQERGAEATALPCSPLPTQTRPAVSRISRSVPVKQQLGLTPVFSPAPRSGSEEVFADSSRDESLIFELLM
ncbi:hypothetical protein SESBI_00819 [Sesbania bispinosa]|nr:hypothetical protein SESBI_00819 [Sesbania bispinosa]